jgi:hypothetical protein
MSVLSVPHFTPSEFPFDNLLGTQKVQSEEQTKKISKGNSEGVK